MILFAGIPSEAPLALAIASAERRGIPHQVSNQRLWDFTDMLVETRDGELQGQLWLNERAWALSDFSAVYARTMDPKALLTARRRTALHPDARRVARAAFMNELFNDWLDVAPQLVVNRPSAMASNVSKPFQAQLIAANGLKSPPTLVTNDPEAVRAFHARHGRIVYKSISSVRSIVREWRPGSGGLERLRWLPTQFQAFIPGTNVRVHVVDTAVHATAISSDATDYRYATRESATTEMSATRLPPAIEEKCIALTKALGLAFSGIDLKRTPDDEWYCFEVNTSPGYSYFEQHTEQPIADALVDYLARGSERSELAQLGVAHGDSTRQSRRDRGECL